MQTAFAGSAGDYRKWLATISTSHERRIEFQIWPLAGGGPIRTLRPKILDGTITYDADRTPSRILDAVFLDPSQSIAFEPEDGETPIHRSRVITVRWSVKVPALGRWVTVRPFTGPIFDFDRTGAEVHLVAHGFDEQGLGEAVHGRTFPAKGSKAVALRWLADQWGDPSLVVPNLGTFPDKFTVAASDQLWPRAQKIVRSAGRQLFHDGRGKLILRTKPARAVLTLGPATLLSPVSIDRNPEFKNRWEIVGAKPKGKKQPVKAHSQLPKSNPLSPQRLARGGAPLYHVHREENTAFKTVAACQKRANELRDDSLRTVSNYSVDCLPMPHLDELDLVTVHSPERTVLVRATQWTLPLGDAPMTLGAIKRASTKTPQRKSRGLKGGGGSAWRPGKKAGR